MLIRYGYEITLTCQQPTALVCLLLVHEDRAADIRVPEHSPRPTLRCRPTVTYSATGAGRSAWHVAPSDTQTALVEWPLPQLYGISLQASHYPLSNLSGFHDG